MKFGAYDYQRACCMLFGENNQVGDPDDDYDVLNNPAFAIKTTLIKDIRHSSFLAYKEDAERDIPVNNFAYSTIAEELWIMFGFLDEPHNLASDFVLELML